jgi:hypothetical protein
VNIVNAVTQFFLKHMQEIENKTGTRLIGVYNSTLASAKEAGMDAEQAEEAAQTTANLAVSMNIAMNLREMTLAAARAGKVLCEVGDPDMVAEQVGLMSPEELREAAKSAACGLTVLLKLMNELLPAVNEVADERHIAEQLLKAGREALAGQVKAKPVKGDVTPFGMRIQPSQN